MNAEKYCRRALLGAIAFAIAGPTAANNAMAQDGPYPPLRLPAFSKSCTRDNIDMLSVAHVNLGRLMEDAISAVTHDSGSKEYKDSFGSPTRQRVNLVRQRLVHIRIGASEAPIQANCIPAGQDSTCDRGAWAYVTKQVVGAANNKYIINFCQSYFTATREFVREKTDWSEVSAMQGAVFLHEMTHFAWNKKHSTGAISGTSDEEYDAEGVKYLADTDPDAAIANADSYHIFMMHLAVRDRSIFR